MGKGARSRTQTQRRHYEKDGGSWAQDSPGEGGSMQR